MTTTRTADAIFADISREMDAAPTDSNDPDFWHAQAASARWLAGLWREMARVAGRDGSPPWAQLAAALLADSLAMRADDAAAHAIRVSH